MKNKVITPIENAASNSVDAPEYALNASTAKAAPTAQPATSAANQSAAATQTSAQAPAAAANPAAKAPANQATQAQQPAAQTAAASAQPATGAATQAPAQQPATAAQTTAKASSNQAAAAQQGTANTQNTKAAAKTQQLQSGAKTQQLKNGAKTQTFTPFENAYFAKNLKIENGRLVGVNGNYSGNLKLTSKNKNTNYTLSFDDGKIVNVKTVSPQKGKSVCKNKIIAYKGNDVQVQTAGTNPIVATAKFDPTTGTYNEVTINGKNNGSMDLQTFLKQVLRVS